MADWVQNRVMVLGAADEVQSFFSFEDDSTPLLHHLPAPSEADLPSNYVLNNLSGMPPEEALMKAFEKTTHVFGIEQAIDMAVASCGRSGWSPYRENVLSDEMPNPFAISVARGDFKVYPEEERNITRFGVPDGDSWRRLVWGSTRAECDLRRDGSVLYFRSANSSAVRGYTTLSRKFPSLVFRCLWYSREVQDDVVIGYAVLSGGRRVAGSNGTVRKADLVPDYEARLEEDWKAARRDLDASLEKLADAWWERCLES